MVNPVNKLEYWIQQTLPSVYDDSLSFVELLGKVMAKLNELIDQSNEYFGQNIEDVIERILLDWKNSGLLTTIINDALFQQKADKTYVDAELLKMANNVKSSAAFLSVLGFGAKGDGVADDSGAIQSVLDLTKTTYPNGVSVYVPAGVYNLNKELHIHRNTHLLMHPNAKLVRKHNDQVLTNYEPTGDNIWGGYSGHGNIVIEGGIFDVNGTNYQDVANGIGLAHGLDITLKDFTILNTPLGHALELTGVKDVLVDNVTFEGCYQDASHNYIEAIQIEACFPPPAGADWTYVYMTDNTTTRDVTIQNCTFKASSQLPSFPTGVGSHGAKYDVFYDNINVIGCTFEGHQYAGIRPFKWRNMVIENNTISNGSGRGIYVVTPTSGASIQDVNGVTKFPQTLDTFSIVNNTIDGVTNDSIVFEAIDTNDAYITDVVISGNVIKNCGGKPLNLDYIKRLKIEGNSFHNNAGRIEISYPIDVIIGLNTVTSQKNNGFMIDNVDGLDIINNTLDGIDLYGFNIAGTSKNIRIDNNRIRNVSISANNTYDGILISSGADNVRITNNTFRSTNANKPRYGMNIQSGVTNLVRFGNDVRTQAVTGAIRDDSTTPITTVTDIIA